MSDDRPTNRPTSTSGPTPMARRRRATRLARAFNSEYVSDSPAQCQGDGLRNPFSLHFDPAMDEARSVSARSGFLPQQPRDQCTLLLQAQTHHSLTTELIVASSFLSAVDRSERRVATR